MFYNLSESIQILIIYRVVYRITVSTDPSILCSHVSFSYIFVSHLMPIKPSTFRRNYRIKVLLCLSVKIDPSIVESSSNYVLYNAF